MGELIDLVIVAIFVYYIIRTLFRLLMPAVVQNVVNKAQQQQQQNAQGRQQPYANYNNTSAGKIKVDHIPDSHRGSIPDSEGEFIDFEEIK